MEERVLVWALGRDGPLTRDVLANGGIHCEEVESVEDLCVSAEAGAGAVIVAAELLTPDVIGYLQAFVGRQPPWSELPILIVAGGESAYGADRLFEALGNVSVLTRPLSLDTLTSSVRTALRARQRQYQLRDLLRQRDEADRRKDEFLAMLAHELRNPLAPIRNAAEVMRLSGAADPALAQVQAVIARQVGHLSRLVDDLLDVSRITRGKITLRKEVIDLGAALPSVAQGASREAADRGLDLIVVPPTPPLHVEADPTRLEQMVGNAVGNAIKFTPAGGRITLSASTEGRYAVIKIADTGVGIPPGMLRHVFELFAQTDRPLDRGQGGLGIGLTVLKALAELHGGDAELRSEGEGKGTEVVIRLPALARTTAGAGPPSERGAGRNGPGLHLLVVDDNLDSAEMLAMILRVHGHEVVCAHDGPTALAAAGDRPPDVAICDIGLPGMSGYELVRRLRDELGLTSCLCLAVTGYGEEKDRRRALEAGFARHFTKPVDIDELVGVLSTRGREGAGW